MNQHAPVIVGVAQLNARAAHLEPSPEPLELMARVARSAAEDCGQPKILNALDALAVVNLISWNYQNAPNALATELAIQPAQQIYTAIGGNTPQYLVNHFAEQIAAGKMRAAMVVGAEAMYSLRRLMKQGGAKWGARAGNGQPIAMGDSRSGTNALEERYAAQWPVQIYPLFENARRASKRWSLEEHRHWLGALCAKMTQVAARNRHAWFPQARSAEEISTVTVDNRIICFPYPKLMNAIIDVDMAAAVIVTSEGEARRLGVPAERMIYLHAGAEATERWFVSERVNYHSSPAIAAGTRAALSDAGVDAAQIDCFDLYSCFPAAVGLAMDALGIPLDDPRPITLTGGLPYAGGPGNNYSTHAIAAAVEHLRSHREQRAMVTALGWYVTKHAFGIYSAMPPERPFRRRTSDQLAAEAEAGASIALLDNAEGAASVETYTVIHDREGAPAQGIVIGRTAAGPRFFAGVPRETLAEMERTEFIGRRGMVKPVQGRNLFTPE